MIIIPAIDIMENRVVRLHQGNFDKQTFYSDDPVEIGRMWASKGAGLIHIVDLDGARDGEIKNRDVITDIIKSVSCRCEVGGGIRTDKDIEDFISCGAERVIIGTRAIEDPEFIRLLIERFGDRVVVSVDFAGASVVKKGWQQDSGMDPVEFAMMMEKTGVKTIEVTDIAVDGTLHGPNIDALKRILRSVNISVIVSGGISSLEDIKRLKEIGSTRLEGVIIGRALYEGKLRLEEAINIVEAD